MTKQIPLAEIKPLHEALMGSLNHFQMEALEPKMSLEVIKDVTIKSELDLGLLDMSYLSVQMWDFVVFTVKGQDAVVPFDPGDYIVEIGQIEKLSGGEFPIRFRQVRVCLNGSSMAWRVLMNTPMN